MGLEVFEDLLFGNGVTVLRQRSHACQRTLLPFGMMNANHCCFGNFWVAHDQVFEVNTGDPLTTAFDQVLGAVHDLDEAFGVDGGDVARSKPAVIEGLSGFLWRALIVVVTGRDPGTTHLQFAHRRAIPGDLLMIVAEDSDVAPWRDAAVAGERIQTGVWVE